MGEWACALCCLPLTVAATAHSSSTKIFLALPEFTEILQLQRLGPLLPQLDQGEAQGAQYLLKKRKGNQCKGHSYFLGQAEATPIISEVKPWT